MYGLPDSLRRLSAAEEQVMLALWRLPPPAGRGEIARALGGGKNTWADATLLNFLYRLEEKGWVRGEKRGGRNLYTPCVSLRAYGVYTMRERLAAVFGGDFAAAVHALLSEENPPSPQLEAALRAITDKRAASEDDDLYDPYG